MLKSVLRKLLLKPLAITLRIAGRAYVPGDKLSDALKIAQDLATRGMSSTLGYFHSAREPNHRIVNISIDLIDAVAKLNPPGYISIKAPALNYDPASIAAIVSRAMEHDTIAHFDSHERITADPTLECVHAAVAQGAQVSLSIPGRWLRSPDDADEMCRLGVRIRVVKGEWADPYLPHLDPNKGFLAVIDRIAGRARSVAIATHDPDLAREALVRLRNAGTPCEIELLNGLPKRKLLALGREFAVPIRVYIPFGIAWRPYALGKLGENPKMLWWLLRDATTGALAKIRRA